MSFTTKIPPPAVAITAGLIMWGIAYLAPQLSVAPEIRLTLALIIALIGLAISVSGAISFRRLDTTLNPTRPEEASSLVTAGIYQVTRNPMYLGLLVILIGWSLFLSSAWALLGAVGFVVYMTRLQIAEEERALTRLFGSEYEAYKTRVRRWL